MASVLKPYCLIFFHFMNKIKNSFVFFLTDISHSHIYYQAILKKLINNGLSLFQYQARFVDYLITIHKFLKEIYLHVYISWELVPCHIPVFKGLLVPLHIKLPPLQNLIGVHIFNNHHQLLNCHIIQPFWKKNTVEAHSSLG